MCSRILFVASTGDICFSGLFLFHGRIGAALSTFSEQSQDFAEAITLRGTFGEVLFAKSPTQNDALSFHGVLRLPLGKSFSSGI